MATRMDGAASHHLLIAGERPPHDLTHPKLDAPTDHHLIAPWQLRGDRPHRVDRHHGLIVLAALTLSETLDQLGSLATTIASPEWLHRAPHTQRS